jgi:hypothetical protein
MGHLGLAEFLADLRAELAEAQARAADDGQALKLRLGPIELSMDVAYTLERAGGVDARAKAKFWVLELGEAGVTGSMSQQRVQTQHLKLVLTPRIERTAVDDAGRVTSIPGEVDVEGPLAVAEENPRVPAPPTSR